MKAEVKPSSGIEKLEENLEERFGNSEINGDLIQVESDSPEKLAKVPGVDIVGFEETEIEGVGGQPLDKRAYIRIESKKDAVTAFLAMLDGYRLTVLNTEREWDLKKLKKYDPDIKHLKANKPFEALEIKSSINFSSENTEKVGIELPEEWDEIYTQYLT